MAKPAYKPSEKDRAMVQTMASVGVQQDEIARCLGIAPKTLRRHFRQELDTATSLANAAVAQRLFTSAKAGNVAAMIFWLKCRAGWKPVSRHELSGIDGEAIKTSHQKVDFDKLEPEEAQALLELLEKAST